MASEAPNPELERKVWDVLECIREQGMDLQGFFRHTMTLGETSRRIKKRQSNFFLRGGFATVLESMCPHMSFGPSRRHTTRSIIELQNQLGDGFWAIVDQVLELEIKTYCKDPAVRLPAGKLTPEVAENFDFYDIEALLKKHCPRMNALVSAICRQGLGDPEEDEGVEKKMRGKDARLVATVSMSMMVYSRCRSANFLQTVFGYYFQAARVRKKPLAVLNRLGLCCSYATVCRAMQGIADANQVRYRRKVREGVPFGWAWDNAVVVNNKAEQSILNQKSLTQYTACFLWFLHIPKPEEGSPYMDAYNELKSMDGIGLAQSGIRTQEEPVDYSSVNDLWLLSADSIAKYLPGRVEAHLSDILWKFLPEVLAGMKDAPERVRQEYLYRIPVVTSDIHALSTLPLDETTIEGTGQILDALISDMDLTKYELLGRGVVHAGDLGTLMKVESLKQLRIRDFSHNRLKHLLRHDGLFHMEMAAQDMLIRAHWGRADGMDPGSLCQLKHILGYKDIVASCPEYNTCRRFTRICAEGHALAAICEAVDAKDLDELGVKLKERGEYHDLLEKVVKDVFVGRAVRVMREEGDIKAHAAWETMLKNTKRNERTGVQLDKKKFLESESRKHRDFVYENFLTFMMHSFGVIDFHHNVRMGDTGGVLKNVEMLALWFNGCGKTHYGKSTANLLIDRKCVWTAAMDYVWHNNILLNISGRPEKWMGVDKVNEVVVNKIKDQHNPRGTWQSKDFFMGPVSRNAFLFNSVQKSVYTKSGAANNGSKHSTVDDKRDVLLVLRTLMSHRVAQWKKGRFMGGSAHNPVLVTESLDLFTLGEKRITRTKFVDKLIQERLEGSKEVFYDPELYEEDEDEEMRDYHMSGCSGEEDEDMREAAAFWAEGRSDGSDNEGIFSDGRYQNTWREGERFAYRLESDSEEDV